MYRKVFLTCLLIAKLFLIVQADSCLDVKNFQNFKFYLIKSFHRSLEEIFYIDNVQNLKECIELAIKYRGLALNYASKERFKLKHEDLFFEPKISRDHFWNQPQLYFNCHILRCPENATLKTLVYDSAFDYYSLYQHSIVTSNYNCLPEVGLFELQTKPATFENAMSNCRHSNYYCGSLAHIASRKRTNTLTHLLHTHNDEQSIQFKPKVYLAYIGLYYNRSMSNKFEMFNLEQESLKCFPYRAWEPSNPKRSSHLFNVSCVALTTERTWKTVDCHIKLPYICEIFTSCTEGRRGYIF